MTKQSSFPKKILVVRFSSIGDIVLTSPVFRCIKKQFPQTEIHFLTKKKYAFVLDDNPYIDQIHCLENNRKALTAMLKSIGFDFLVDLHNNLRTFRLKAALGIKSASFPKLNTQKWLLVNLKIDRMPALHIVDRYFKTLEKIGVSNDQAGLDFFLDPNDLFDFSTLPTVFSKGYVVYAIGGQHNTKKMPSEQISKLCQQIDAPLVLLGGKEDQAAAAEIKEKSAKKNLIDLCGQLSFNQSAHIVQLSQQVITHDTGLMHVAAAMKKNLHVIWGNTVPAFGMYPYAANFYSWEIKGLSCRPCSKIGFQSCPKKHFNCMNQQDLVKIAQTVNEHFKTQSFK